MINKKAIIINPFATYMKNLSFSIILFFSITSSLVCQSKHDYIWLFGVDEQSFPNETGYLFDFTGSNTEIIEHDNNISIGKANTSISDKDGNLLFYMNGCAVMNRNFEMMPDGDRLSYNIIWQYLNYNCNRGSVGSFQDHLILTDPADEDEFYILHKPFIYNGIGIIDSIQIWYSKVDMTKEDGLGDVIAKNQIFDNSKIFLSSYLTAINHKNGDDWWVLQAPIQDSVFHTYLIDSDGFRLNQIQNSHHFMTRNRTSASGTAKFSPDGTKYAFYNYYDQLHIYDFDRSTGLLSNHLRIDVIEDPDYFNLLFSSLEFSPNGRFIYCASSTVLYQVDLWEEDIQSDGIRLIDTYNGTQDPFSTTFFLMAQAPDCKIYMCSTSATNSYHVIKKPNELGEACEFVQNGVMLPHQSHFGNMPNFPRFRVDEEEKCDPTLTSVFGDAVYYRRELTVYPSPSDGQYTIEVPDDFRSGTLSVINLDGQVVETKQISSGTLSIDVNITRYPNGYYHVELYPDENNQRVFWSKQVVKQ